jgi:hypothetical protein
MPLTPGATQSQASFSPIARICHEITAMKQGEGMLFHYGTPARERNARADTLTL